MEKIKDFFYEKSDIFFATVVVALVVVVVMRNLGGWMNVEAEDSKYNEIQAVVSEEPAGDDSTSTNNDGSDTPAQLEEPTEPAAPSTEEPASNEEPKEEPAETPAVEPTTPDAPPEQPTQTPSSGQSRNITVAPGSAAKSIADALKAQGLISDSSAFVQALISSGNDTKLKAGDFTIPEGASTEQIIAILTK